MKALLLLSTLFLFSLNSTAAPAPSAKEILEKIDELYRQESSFAKMTMNVETPNWTREMKLDTWSRGMDETLIRILAPQKDRGVSTLRRNNEMWNYFPKINKVIKIPPSMMMGSWMGSDFTNDDLVRESSLIEDYDVTMTEEKDTYNLTLIPKKETATVWGKIIAKVRKSDLIPLSYEYYDEKGAKVRIMEFSNIKTFDGHKLPSTLTLTPLNKEGHKTTVTYEDIDFDVKIDDTTFSLRNLKKRL